MYINSPEHRITFCNTKETNLSLIAETLFVIDNNQPTMDLNIFLPY